MEEIEVMACGALLQYCSPAAEEAIAIQLSTQTVIRESMAVSPSNVKFEVPDV